MRFLPVAVLAVALMIGPADADVLDPRESAAFIDGNLLRDMCADPGASHARPWSRCVAEPASAALTRWFSIGQQASGRGLPLGPSAPASTEIPVGLAECAETSNNRFSNTAAHGLCVPEGQLVSSDKRFSTIRTSMPVARAIKRPRWTLCCTTWSASWTTEVHESST
jgi:hypothetical protein